ncbi:MAG: hypothetical protein ISS01_01715 [Nanoarchaeota archaeon]|nr:hypothetical protein [Nanoarchaeota archaeon]
MTLEKKLELQDTELILVQPFKRIGYLFRPDRVFLDSESYCHVFDRASGDTFLVEGPQRKVLKYDERISGEILEKVVVPDRHYTVIENPLDNETGKVQYGEREVREGPKVFALHPGEVLAQEVTSEHILTKNDAIHVQALSDFGEHKAGDKFSIKGPRNYVPSKDEKVLRQIKAKALSDTDGVYVQNVDSGEARLVKGPQEYFLEANEDAFRKELTENELEALGLRSQIGRSGVRVLTRQAANTSFLKNSSNACVLELEDKEVVFLYDGSDTRIIQGPKTEFLGPYERPRVLSLSGGKPIRPNALKIALLKLGPDFIYDQVIVRTKDNAKLKVDVTYKWRFSDSSEEGLRKAFSIDDFVGYAAETLSSDIRTVAAQHDFEEFHAGSLEYITKEIFGEDEKLKVFEENGLEIFGIDVTGITPEDSEVADKLNGAIKQNMEIYCDRLVLKAKLEAEKQEVEGKRDIEKQRAELIIATIQNERTLEIERSKIKAEGREIDAESEAGQIRIVGEARRNENLAELSAKVERLSREDASNFIELERIKTFSDTEKLVIVPTDAQFVLPYLGGEKK